MGTSYTDWKRNWEHAYKVKSIQLRYQKTLPADDPDMELFGRIVETLDEYSRVLIHGDMALHGYRPKPEARGFTIVKDEHGNERHEPVMEEFGGQWIEKVKASRQHAANLANDVWKRRCEIQNDPSYQAVKAKVANEETLTDEDRAFYLATEEKRSHLKHAEKMLEGSQEFFLDHAEDTSAPV